MPNDNSILNELLKIVSANVEVDEKTYRRLVLAAVTGIYAALYGANEDDQSSVIFKLTNHESRLTVIEKMLSDVGWFARALMVPLTLSVLAFIWALISRRIGITFNP